MKVIDHRGKWNDILHDQARFVPNAHVISICKFHSGKSTCRYLWKDAGTPLVCVKKSRIKKYVDSMVANGQMGVQGDNCEGIGENEKETIPQI
jgi:hypothetical protein